MCCNKGVVYGEELLLDVWDFAAQEALWGLHASLHSLFICVFLKGGNSHSEAAC